MVGFDYTHFFTTQMPNQRREGLVYVSAHTEAEKLEAFDEIWKAKKYPSRSAAIDALMTLAMTDEKVIETILRLARKR